MSLSHHMSCHVDAYVDSNELVLTCRRALDKLADKRSNPVRPLFLQTETRGNSNLLHRRTDERHLTHYHALFSSVTNILENTVGAESQMESHGKLLKYTMRYDFKEYHSAFESKSKLPLALRLLRMLHPSRQSLEESR